MSKIVSNRGLAAAMRPQRRLRYGYVLTLPKAEKSPQDAGNSKLLATVTQKAQRGEQNEYE